MAPYAGPFRVETSRRLDYKGEKYGDTVSHRLVDKDGKVLGTCANEIAGIFLVAWLNSSLAREASAPAKGHTCGVLGACDGKADA